MREKRKFVLTLPHREPYYFYAEDSHDADDIIAAQIEEVEDEDRELTEAEKKESYDQERFDSWREK